MGAMNLRRVVNGFGLSAAGWLINASLSVTIALLVALLAVPAAHSNRVNPTSERESYT
jgi:hypothetical protein